VVTRIVVVAVLACAADVASAQDSTIDRVKWLQGCWQATRGEATIEEQWMAPRGGTMLGMSRTVRGGRTAEYELVIIREQDGALAYEAHPSGQASTTFLSTTVSDMSVVFENPKHDFPQRVGYQRDGADGLLAWIDGEINGKARRVDFAHRRARCEAPQGGTR
jgi:hypothetical protein